MALDAVLFDIDGTLLDTNAAHVDAWLHALTSCGYRVGRDRIEEEIGKGGDKLVPSILGKEADSRDGEALRKAQSEEFARIGKQNGFVSFPGALELLDELRQRGYKVALATSSSKKNLRVLEEGSGVKLESVCDLLVCADDAAQSKPAPDIVEAAVRKLGMSAAQCALIGDTPYDIQAAKHAGVIGLGVRTGFQTTETLLRSGARAVFADVAEIRTRLDSVLKLASPRTLHLTQKLLEELMTEALAQAQTGMESGEAPIGAVLCDGEGKIVARGFNQMNRLGDRSAHAEMVALRAAAGQVSSTCRDLILVSTLEPCVMCTGAAMETAVETLVYGLQAPADSGTGRVQPPQSSESQMPRIVGNVKAKESRALFEQFVRIAKNPQQRAFAEELLALTKKDGRAVD